MAKESEKKTKSPKMPKPNQIIVVPTSLGSDFFRWWCVFLRPFIKLTDREIDVLACLLKHRYVLSNSISDSTILDSYLMSPDTHEKIIKECNISLKHFYVILSKLRKYKAITGNIINPKIIPNVRQEDNGEFKLLVLFKNKEVA